MEYEDLVKELEKLKDLEAIKQLKCNYAMACDDDHNTEKLGELFLEDAVWHGNRLAGRKEGKKAILEYFSQIAIDRSIHYFVMPKIVLDGETATASWYALVGCTLKASEDKNKAMWLSGRQFDKYHKINGKWFIKEVIAERFFVSKFDFIASEKSEDSWFRHY